MAVKVKATLQVLTGAISFGLLGSVIKLARQAGYSVAAITFAQMATGCVLLLLLNFLPARTPKALLQFTAGEKLKVVLHGVCVGLINAFYILSLRYGTAATSIVLLAQSVWMSITLESILSRTWPSRGKLMAVVLILAGTVLVSKPGADAAGINGYAVLFGLLAAITSTVSIYCSSRVVVHKSPLRRTFYLSLGCLLTVSLVYGTELLQQFDPHILRTWGLLAGACGMVLTPLMYSKGMPVAGVGLSSILSSLQIPAAAVFACIILGEQVSGIQWLGITLLTGAIIWMNRGNQTAKT